MNFDELEAIISEQAGVDICPICGTPFHKSRPVQKTCGTDECKRLWKNKYLRDLRKRKMEEDPEAFRTYRASAQRKYRHKKRGYEKAEKQYEELQEYWEKREAAIVPYKDGMTYAERQVAKTLALVPPIDTNIEGSKK